jgi:hypothetical protein
LFTLCAFGRRVNTILAWVSASFTLFSGVVAILTIVACVAAVSAIEVGKSRVCDALSARSPTEVLTSEALTVARTTLEVLEERARRAALIADVLVQHD